MASRVSDVLSIAFERTQTICVQGFEPTKWLSMAVASWLAWLGSSQGNISGNLPNPGGSGGGGSLPSDWILFDPWIVTAVSVGVVIVLVILIGVTWLRSRGQAMFIDLVARDADDVAAAWSSQGALGFDLFKVRIIIDLIGFAVLMVVGGAGAGLALWLEAHDPTQFVWAPVVAGGLLAGAFVLVWAFVTFVLDELVLPVAYAWQVPIRDAVAEVRRMASDTPAAFVTYLGVRLVAAFAVGIVAGALSCLLCFIAWLPFVSALFLLPFRVFVQSLPLAFLHQLNPDAYSAYAPLASDSPA